VEKATENKPPFATEETRMPARGPKKIRHFALHRGLFATIKRNGYRAWSKVLLFGADSGIYDVKATTPPRGGSVGDLLVN